MSKLYFRYGAMNCGKSTHLLQVANNYKERGMNAMIIKPLIDTKSDNFIVSRLGATQKVDFLVRNTYDIQQIEWLYKKYDCILVDEAQFLTSEMVDALYILTKKVNKPVICYGLRCDFKMNGFAGATRLLEIADTIEEMKTICRCGHKATQNARFVNGQFTTSGEQVCIDNQYDISYESMCGECYLRMTGKMKELE